MNRASFYSNRRCAATPLGDAESPIVFVDPTSLSAPESGAGPGTAPRSTGAANRASTEQRASAVSAMAEGEDGDGPKLA